MRGDCGVFLKYRNLENVLVVNVFVLRLFVMEKLVISLKCNSGESYENG